MAGCRLGLLCLGLALCSSAACAADAPQPGRSGLLAVTESGYLRIGPEEQGAALFFAFYEHAEARRAPILLWLEGGPGCASMLGNLYIQGPQFPNSSLHLIDNPGTWAKKYAMLYIDQPIGTGFSTAGKRQVPTDELEVATDLYAGLQAFFRPRPALQDRPLFITGESYAGKYVPSIGHFILDVAERLGPLGGAPGAPPLARRRRLPARALGEGPPCFSLAGLAIGNGLTEPRSQVLLHAEVAYSQGLIDAQQRDVAEQMQAVVAGAIDAGAWREAHELRERLLQYITDASGAGTLLDGRRLRDYDARQTVDRYLNQPHVKEALGVPANLTFASCSEGVGAALGPDVMKTVAPLVPDILARLPLLLYQGATDVQDGVASNEGWTLRIPWRGQAAFAAAARQLWLLPRGCAVKSDPWGESGGDGPCNSTGWLVAPGGKPSGAGSSLGRGRPPASAEVVGYLRRHATLTNIVVRNAGHMVPHDQPLVAQKMIELWVDSVLEQGWDRGQQRSPAAAALR